MPTTTVVIDALAVATNGILIDIKPNVIDPLSIATSGLWIVITEEIIDVVIPAKVGGAADPRGPYHYYREEKKKKKRITATATINGVEYSNTIEVDDLSISAKDVKVEVTDSEIPQLKITVMRGKK